MRNSLRGRVALGVIIATLVVSVLAVATGWGLFFWRELHEQQVHLHGVDSTTEIEKEGAEGKGDRLHVHAPYPDEVRILRRPRAGDPPVSSDSVLRMWGLPEGVSTVRSSGHAWRIAVKTIDSDTRVVVAQRLSSQARIAGARAARSLLQLLPLLLFVPLFLLLVSSLIANAFAPLEQISEDLDSRRKDDLTGIPSTSIPVEIKPFVTAINRLLGRIEASILLQRRFVADAAHELRTPLAALSLQAERLEALDLPASARARAGILQEGIQRLQRLTDQLLAHARSQSPMDDEICPCSLRAAVREVFEDLVPLAEAQDIDLGIVDETDATITCRPADLPMLIRNLVENAVKNTPAGGKIDVGIQRERHGCALLVEDTGSGIPPEDREKVFEPFYRRLEADGGGSGLGLSIVRTIAERLGAVVTLDARADGGPGLQVWVNFCDLGQRECEEEP